MQLAFYITSFKKPNLRRNREIANRTGSSLKVKVQSFGSTHSTTC